MARRRSSRRLGWPGGWRGVSLAVGCVVLLAVSACSSSSSSKSSNGSGGASAAGGSCSGSQSDIKIAVIADLSGQATTLVQHGKAVVAAATAAHLANTSGGIACHPVKLVVHDGAGSAQGVAQAVREAINDHPVAITGFALSGYLSSAVPLISEAKIPWISASNVFAGVVNLPYFYSTVVSNEVLGTDSAEAAKRQLGGSLQGKRVAFAGAVNSAAVDELLAAFKKTVEAGGGTVGPVFRDSASFTEWSSQAVNTVSAHADAVVAYEANPTMLTLADALKTAKYSGPLIGIFAAPDTVFQKINNTPPYSTLRSAAFPTDGTPLADAVTAAGASLSDANASSYFGQEFAAATVLLAALRKCGAKCDTDQFVKAVDAVVPFTVPLNGLLGPMTFNKTVATYPVGLAQMGASQKVELVGGNLSS